jgi:hypothetical protein
MQKFIRFAGKALLLAGILVLLWWLALAIFLPLEGMETGYLNLAKDADLCATRAAQRSHQPQSFPVQLISRGLISVQVSLSRQ